MKNLVVAVALFAAGTLFAAPCGEAGSCAKDGPKAACECKSGKPCKCAPECKCADKGDKCKCDKGPGEGRRGQGPHGRRMPKYKKCDCSPNCPGVIILPPDSEEGEPLFKLFKEQGGKPGEGMGRGRGRRPCKCGKGPNCDCPRPRRRNRQQNKPE